MNTKNISNNRSLFVASLNAVPACQKQDGDTDWFPAVDVTETGSSLKAHNLRIVETVCESVTQLVANRKAYAEAWKREKLENIGMLMQGAIRAQEMVGLKMNVPGHCREAVMARLEALSSPTVSPLAQEGWIAAEVVIAESTVRRLVPELRRIGATGIIEYPLNKIVP